MILVRTTDGSTYRCVSTSRPTVVRRVLRGALIEADTNDAQPTDRRPVIVNGAHVTTIIDTAAKRRKQRDDG